MRLDVWFDMLRKVLYIDWFAAAAVVAGSVEQMNLPPDSNYMNAGQNIDKPKC